MNDPVVDIRSASMDFAIRLAGSRPVYSPAEDVIIWAEKIEKWLTRPDLHAHIAAEIEREATDPNATSPGPITTPIQTWLVEGIISRIACRLARDFPSDHTIAAPQRILDAIRDLLNAVDAIPRKAQ